MSSKQREGGRHPDDLDLRNSVGDEPVRTEAEREQEDEPVVLEWRRRADPVVCLRQLLRLFKILPG